jgi:RNA ligase
MLNYPFPTIETIDDVLPNIQGREEFKVYYKEWYTTIKYMVINKNTFDWDDTDPVGSSIRRECRGLIFDQDGKLISRPYHKFFNAGEREETQINKINLYEPHIILEKLDGSMVRTIQTPEGFRLATKFGITDTSMNAEVFIADKPNYREFILKTIESYTHIFEWVSRKDRIIIDYPEDNLILTGVRNIKTGAYISYETMKNIADYYNITVVKAVNGLPTQNINLFVDTIREWDDGEGVVLRFDTGNMVKVKTKDYVLKHSSIETLKYEKNVIALIIQESVDDVIPLLIPEDAKKLCEFENDFWKQFNETCTWLTSLYELANVTHPDQKDFAVNYVQKLETQYIKPVMYELRRGKTVEEILKTMIFESTYSQTKVDENRWIWGHLKWSV